jgi:hypothetical protein
MWMIRSRSFIAECRQPTTDGAPAGGTLAG